MSTTQSPLKPGQSVTIQTKYDGLQPAVITSEVNGRVLVLFQDSIQINNRGERSTWAWSSVERLAEVIV